MLGRLGQWQNWVWWVGGSEGAGATCSLPLTPIGRRDAGDHFEVQAAPTDHALHLQPLQCLQLGEMRVQHLGAWRWLWSYVIVGVLGVLEGVLGVLGAIPGVCFLCVVYECTPWVTL